MSVSILNTRSSSGSRPANRLSAVTSAGPGTDFLSVTRPLLPNPIVYRGGSIEQWQAPLPFEEAVYVRNAVQRRVREFTAGRNCARAALEQIGYEDVTIPMGQRRQPMWPAGVVGSISHGAGYCLAAVCSRKQFASLGVDIEAAIPLSPSLMRLVCTPVELEWCEAQGSALAGLLAKFHFSAKESVFKCLYPVFGEELEFHDVHLDLSLHEERFVAHVGGMSLDPESELVVRGRFACTDQLVLTSAVLQDVDYQCMPVGFRFTSTRCTGLEDAGCET